METCEKSRDLRLLGWKTIREHEDLRWIRESRIRVGFCYSDKQKTKDGRMVFAECHKVKALYQPWTPYDFIIVFYEPNTMMLDERQREILMYHELLHVGMEDSGSLKIRPHDIEDFRVILDQYGLDWNMTEGDSDGT